MVAEKPFDARYSSRIEIGLILIGLVTLFFCLSFDITGDGYIRFRALRRLVNADRLVSMSHSMIGPLFAMLLWPLGRLYESAEWWIERFNFFVFAGGLFFFYRLMREQFDPGVARRFLLVLMFASMFPSHVKDFYGAVFTAMFVGVGLLATQTGHPRWGWTGVVVGAANTPASMVGLGAVGASESFRTRRWRFVLAPFIGLLIYALESWIRRGSPWISGYEGNGGAETVLTYSGRPGFSYPFFFGLLSVLFSFGKGLVFFAPGLLLSLDGAVRSLGENLRRTHRLWLWFLAGMVVVYAKWWAWYGGWTWGPRFFLFASIPAAFALAVSLERRESSLGRDLGLLAIMALSFWVGLSGAVFGLGGLEGCRPAESEFLCWYVPEFSALWRPFVVTIPLEGKEYVLLAYGLLVFGYLAAPLFKRLWGSAGEGATRAKAYLCSERWEF